MPHRPLALRASLGFLVLIGTGVAAEPDLAFAADLDPGYTEMPSLPPQQMVTFGSGWYVRGDLAATDLGRVALGPTNAPAVVGASTSIPVGIYNSRTVSYDASLGGGYAFNNNIRVDLTADFFQPSQTMRRGVYCKTGDGYCATFGSIDRYAALINGYYDIGTWSIFTPYVGAGVGVEYASINTYGDGAYAYVDPTRYKSTSFAWALMAGVAVDVYQHVKLDIGYRYLAAPSLAGSNVANHEIRAGLRYMIDN